MPAPDNGLIGIDIRGTKIDAPVFDQADKIIFEKRLDTPKDYEPMVKAIAGLVQAAGAGTVGIGALGSGHPETGTRRNSYFVASNGKPMLKDLEVAIGRPNRIENDDNCFVLSEAKNGTGAGFGVVAFLPSAPTLTASWRGAGHCGSRAPAKPLCPHLR